MEFIASESKEFEKKSTHTHMRFELWHMNSGESLQITSIYSIFFFAFTCDWLSSFYTFTTKWQQQRRKKNYTFPMGLKMPSNKLVSPFHFHAVQLDTNYVFFFVLFSGIVFECVWVWVHATVFANSAHRLFRRNGTHYTHMPAPAANLCAGCVNTMRFEDSIL